MVRKSAPLQRALSLMKEALNVLDANGDGDTAMACHLQLAIDVAKSSALSRASRKGDVQSR